MATDNSFVEYVIDQLSSVKTLRSKKMFGEYAIYVQEKLVVLVCDNQVFVKITNLGRNFAKGLEEASPYPGAKPCFLVGDKIEDIEWFQEFVTITAQELPLPKPKKSNSKRG